MVKFALSRYLIKKTRCYQVESRMYAFGAPKRKGCSQTDRWDVSFGLPEEVTA